MKITFSFATAISVVVFSVGILASTFVGCTPTQAQQAQNTLTKVEGATTQAINAGSTVSATTPPPVSNYAELFTQLAVLALAVEKFGGAYVIPFLTKLGSGNSQSQLTSNQNPPKPTA